MKNNTRKPANIDEYISAFPSDVREKLVQVREAIRKAAPDAQEVISYQMPAFRLGGILVYFAAHKSHIGFYPTSSGIEAFEHEFSGLEYSKGAVQFPLDKPIPVELIERIVKFRAGENLSKIKVKPNRKK